MPPRTRFTKGMILDAAFELARESGIESVNARSVANRLQCSTHPVMYCFSTVDDIRRGIYERAIKYHTEFTESSEGGATTMLAIGAAYVRFAAEEKHLFRLLFQSDHFSRQTFGDVIDDESVQPLIEAISEQYGISHEEAKEAFAARFLMVHGMASMLANNSMIYDESVVMRLLKMQFAQDVEVRHEQQCT